MFQSSNNRAPWWGNKSIAFPTIQGLPLDDYPDITDSLQSLRFNAFSKINNAKSSGLNRFLLESFQPRGTFDTFLMPHLPGFDEDGSLQWARYKGVAVPASYVQHNLLGNVLGAAGFKNSIVEGDEIDPRDDRYPWDERDSEGRYPWDPDFGKRGPAKRPSPGSILDFILPGGEALSESIIPKHEFGRWEVNSGYRDYRTGDPWGQKKSSTFPMSLNAAPIVPDANGVLQGGVSVNVGLPGPDGVLRGGVSKTGGIDTGGGFWGTLGNILLNVGIGAAQGYLQGKLNQAQQPQGWNNTVVLNPAIRPSITIDNISPPVLPQAVYNPIQVPRIPSQLPNFNFPQSDPLSKIRGNNLPQPITNNPNTNPGEVIPWPEYQAPEVKPAPQQPNYAMPPMAPTSSIWNMVKPIPSATAPSSPWATSPDVLQQRQNEAMLKELQALHMAMTRGNSVSRGGIERKSQQNSANTQYARQRANVKTDTTTKFNQQLTQIRKELDFVKQLGTKTLKWKILIEDYRPGGRWDFQNQTEQGWPGAGTATHYNGKIVSGAYFGNAGFGYGMRHMEYSRQEILDIADKVSRATRYGQPDQFYDTQAIISGMDLYDYNDPWYHGVPYLETYGPQ